MYKTGDKIVLVNPDSISIRKGYQKGQEFIVNYFGKEEEMVTIQENKFVGFYLKEIALKEVAESPLFQLMKETDE